MNSSRLKTFIVHWGGSCFLAAILLIHLGLVGLGQWLADEYSDFGRLERDRWAFVWDRLKWSPRPLSEFLYCTYGWVVNHSHRPLIWLFLGILWAGLIVAGLFTVWQTYRNREQEDIWPSLLVALALMALFVTSAGDKVWIFYWPAAAVAYLPTLGATTLLFLQIAHGRLSSSGGRLLCAGCLTAAACSSEAGATFVLCYGLLQAAQWGVAAVQKRGSLLNQPVAWWLLPALVSVVVLLVVRLNRFHIVELPGIPVGPTKGHPLASLISSAHELGMEVLGRSAHFFGWRGPGSRLPSEILLALGAGLCWSRFGRLPRVLVAQMLTIVGALWLASLFTIAAANLHFGVVCCDQHEVLRRCWMLLGIAGIGMLLSGWIGGGRLRRYAGSGALAQVLLCAAVLAAWHMKPVFGAYRVYRAVWQTTEQNFQAGFSTSEQMIFLRLPETLIAQPQIAPGTYNPGTENPSDVQYVLTYFHKSGMVVRSFD